MGRNRWDKEKHLRGPDLVRGPRCADRVPIASQSQIFAASVLRFKFELVLSPAQSSRRSSTLVDSPVD